MEASVQDQGNVVRELGLPIYESKGWLKLLGVVSIISGVLSAISVFGIIFAWLPIWMGVLLFQSATAVERSQLTGDKAAFNQSLSKLKTYFIISGVMAIIGLATAAVATVVALTFGTLGALSEILNELG
jgi:hypothetical protein